MLVSAHPEVVFLAGLDVIFKNKFAELAPSGEDVKSSLSGPLPCLISNYFYGGVNKYVIIFNSNDLFSRTPLRCNVAR